MAGQVLVKLAVVEEFFDRQFAFEHGKQVLRRDAVAGLIKEDGQDIGVPPAGVPCSIKPRMITTSGTVSYGPPEWPDKPRAPA